PALSPRWDPSVRLVARKHWPDFDCTPLLRSLKCLKKFLELRVNRSIRIRPSRGIVSKLEEGSAKSPVNNGVDRHLLAPQLKLALDVPPKSVIQRCPQVLGPLAEKGLPPAFQLGTTNTTEKPPALQVIGLPLRDHKRL